VRHAYLGMNSTINPTEFCLYLDNAGYMKHNFTTQNLCQSSKTNKIGSHKHHTALKLGYANLLVVHFSSRLLISNPRTKNSINLECLNYMQHRLTPDLASYPRIHAYQQSKKVILICLGHKTYHFYSCMHSSTRLTKF